MSSLIPDIERGVVPNVPFPFEKSIETSSSKVHLCGDRAYKVYKREDHYYGNFLDVDFRRQFIEDEMHWNMTLAPETYLEFRGMSVRDGVWERVAVDEADDVLIIMERVSTPNLTALLRSNEVNLEQLKIAVKLMTSRAETLSLFTTAKRYPFRKNGWQKIFFELVEGIHTWAPQADPLVPKEWSADTTDVLLAYIKQSSYFADFPERMLAASVDCHSDNVFFPNNQPVFLDSMLPKEGWRIVDPFCNTAKFAVDVTAYYGTDARDALYAEYALQHPLPPENIRILYETCYALLKCIYVGLLGPQDAIPRYRKIVDNNLHILA